MSSQTNEWNSAPKLWQHSLAPFAIGGVSGSVATTLLHPIDMIKVRVQITSEGHRNIANDSTLTLARQILAEGSFLRFYNGLSAAYLRQLTYTTLRIGFFDAILANLQQQAERQRREIGFAERAFAGLSGGGLAAWICTPVEVALIRMQSDGLKPLAQQKKYPSVLHALTDIGKTQGIEGLWKGSTPTAVRAMATNFGQLAFFAESKARLRSTDLSQQTQTACASGIAGFFAAFFSLPSDFLKTRMQKADMTSSNLVMYRSMTDCAVKVVRTEGLLRFYRGFGLYFLRIAPHSFITLMIADNLRALVTGSTF